MLLKSEGLVISGVGILIILIAKSGIKPNKILTNLYITKYFLFIPLACFVLWKVYCLKFGIHNYLTENIHSTAVKLIERLSDFKSFWIFEEGFGYRNRTVKLMIYAALIRRFVFFSRISKIEKMVTMFVVVYITFLFVTYMSTPFDLNWQLDTSILRTAAPIMLLTLVTLVIRDIDVAKKI
jgi:hypothetical protein